MQYFSLHYRNIVYFFLSILQKDSNRRFLAIKCDSNLYTSQTLLLFNAAHLLTIRRRPPVNHRENDGFSALFRTNLNLQTTKKNRPSITLDGPIFNPGFLSGNRGLLPLHIRVCVCIRFRRAGCRTIFCFGISRLNSNVGGFF